MFAHIWAKVETAFYKTVVRSFPAFGGVHALLLIHIYIYIYTNLCRSETQRITFQRSYDWYTFKHFGSIKTELKGVRLVSRSRASPSLVERKRDGLASETSVRPHQNVLSSGCPFEIQFNYDCKVNAFVINICQKTHNHPVGPHIAKQHPCNHRLNSKECRECMVSFVCYNLLSSTDLPYLKGGMFGLCILSYFMVLWLQVPCWCHRATRNQWMVLQVMFSQRCIINFDSCFHNQ